ncbi:glycosyltransferase family 2 protein [Candidatus Peregrinibacteria bacterium]|nr:MAG: glycosyltransferase family 2 protein [Candidatus Peregrinibacteria bacterium]
MLKVLIGLSTYNDLPFLKESLPALEELRKRLGAKVAVLDTAWNDEVQHFIAEKYPHFDYGRHPDGNVGYGGAYNTILQRNPGYDLFLVTTSDVLLHVPTVERFVKRMEKDPSLTQVAGKLYHWDLAAHRLTKEIDSLGIVAMKKHHFYDRGQGELDEGQYDEILGQIFGISGAVFLIRTSVVPRLHRRLHVLFDEHFWMYKEDVDLAYRLRWLGEKIELFPEVWGWHARSISNRAGEKGQRLLGLAAADRKKRDYARLHSYKNHFLLLKNNFTLRLGLGVFLRILCYEMAKGIFVFFHSPRVFFSGLKTLFFSSPHKSVKKVNPSQLLSHFLDS